MCLNLQLPSYCLFSVSSLCFSFISLFLLVWGHINFQYFYLSIFYCLFIQFLRKFNGGSRDYNIYFKFQSTQNQHFTTSSRIQTHDPYVSPLTLHTLLQFFDILHIHTLKIPDNVIILLLIKHFQKLKSRHIVFNTISVALSPLLIFKVFL